jgi:hypothetical protein
MRVDESCVCQGFSKLSRGATEGTVDSRARLPAGDMQLHLRVWLGIIDGHDAVSCEIIHRKENDKLTD